MSDAFPDRDVTRELLAAERQIRLIDRVAPVNLIDERARLLAALQRNERPEPRLQYQRPPELSAVRASLSQLAEVLDQGPTLARLYAARAAELEREAALVEAIASPRFRTLSRLRFQPDWEIASADLRALVGAWLAVRPEPGDAEAIVSDDEAHPESLVSILRARIAASKQAIRVELRPRLATVAAAGQDIVLVRPGVLLSPARALRIALHELEGHVFPRLAAERESLGLFRAGARRSAEHEEGRALLIEERAGLLDGERRRELALRHLAASAIRDGAAFMDSVDLLREHGTGVAQALELTLRALRGGGLAREVVYLPAYLNVRRAFSERPGLERWFERGRLSLEAARALDQRLESREATLEPRAESA
jgi:hypothetical protein